MSHSALVATEVGMLVRRFPTAAAARAAELDRETDGLPASLMARVCSWCNQSMGAVVCEPALAGKITHGICPACQERLLGELPGVPALSLSPVTPGVNEVAAGAAVSTLPGTQQPQQVKGITAPDAPASAALEHLSGGPATSSLFPAERFWCVQGSDFGRVIAWARRQPRVVAEAIRARILPASAQGLRRGSARAAGAGEEGRS
jgi:hypothetical protein